MIRRTIGIIVDDREHITNSSRQAQAPHHLQPVQGSPVQGSGLASQTVRSDIEVKVKGSAEGQGNRCKLLRRGGALLAWGRFQASAAPSF